MTRYFFALVFALSGTLATGQVYKWVDENGRVQYGDKPPAGARASAVKPPPEPQGTSRPAENLVSQEAEFQNRLIQSREKEEKLAREAQLQQQRCTEAKERLALYERAGRISRFEKGEKVYLSDEQRAAEIERLNAAAAKYCR